jgi:AcrR family transcriptional regulator
MPRLWTTTIEAHRQEVREAILGATSRLVAEHGIASVSMSQIAEAAGIGRATLYKYFSDVETILATWHAGIVEAHVQQLRSLADQPTAAGERLASVLHAYAFLSHHRHSHGSDLVALLHRSDDVTRAQHELVDLIRGLIEEAAQNGGVRTDVAAAELAVFCLHALGAAASLPSKAAVRRLVDVTLGALAVG